MPRTIRSRNLDLIRWLNSGHQPVVKKLIGLTNSAYISQMALGERPIETSNARSIETLLGMPKGWMDRDNVAIIQMQELDYALHEKVARLSEEGKKGLLALLTATPA